MSLTTLQSWEYLASYGDLINAFGPNVAKASAHYDTFVATHIETRPITFDAWGYLASYDDLISAFHSDVIAAARHYVTYGYNEHRDTNTFDAQAYLNNYSDLQAAFGSNLVKAEEHYVTFGRAEGRNDYTLTAASASSLDASGHVAEGHTVQFTLDTHDLAQGTTFAYAITGAGITLSDLASGTLSGVATVGADGKAIVSVNLAADHTTEGAETLTLTTATHSASIIVDDASPLDPVGTFTLTGDTDIKVAADGINKFIAPQVYTPGGNDRINSLQDEDVLTGTGVNPTLTATLGNYNDNGAGDITPTLIGIETVNVKFTNDAVNNIVLDLQDSDLTLGTATQYLKNVNVTGIASAGSYVANLHAAAVNLSATNTHDLADVTFTYLNNELVGSADTVNLKLTNVNADNLYLGSEKIISQQIETVNIVVESASSAMSVNLGADQRLDTFQTLNINAKASFIIGDDVNGDATGALHDLGYIEENNGFVYGTVGSLKTITVEGAGNVTLASVGNPTGFVLDGAVAGHVATGNIAVNISNAAGDSTARFTTGDGNDTVLVDTHISGYHTVSGGGSVADYADVTLAAGSNEASGNANAADNHAIVYGVVTGKGDDVVIAHDLAITAGISTGDGNDVVTVHELFGSVGAPIIKDYVGATINLGDGNNVANAYNLGEEARIISGSGNDVINLQTVLNDGAGKTVIHADSGTLDADTNSAEVNTGAGDDFVNFTFTGAGLNDLVGFSVIEGLVNGGEGNDEITVTGNKDLDLVLSNSGDVPRVSNVETLTLNSTTAYDAHFKSVFDASGVRTIAINDNNAETADYTVNVNEFDSKLQTINLNHYDGVIRNIFPEVSNWTAFNGDKAVDTLYNLRGTEQINIKALETNLLDPHLQPATGGTWTGISAANDKLGTVYSAGDSATTFAAAFNSDLDVNLRLQTNAIATDVAHVTLLDVATPSDPASSPLDPLDANYDVSIDDIANNDVSAPTGSLGSDLYEALDLKVNGSHNHGVDLNNDFDVTLTVSGTDTKGGNLTLINVDAANIDTTGYEGNVYVGVESTYNHIIKTGIGNDIVRLGDEKAIALGNDSVELGDGNDIVVFNGTGVSTVNHAGLNNLDTVKGGAGNDILAFGGQTSYTPLGQWIGVTLGATEWQNVSGFETIQLSVGQATPESSVHDYSVGFEPHGTHFWLPGQEVFINNGDYVLNITNDLIDANGNDVLHIVNNNVNDAAVTANTNNGTVSLSSCSLIQLAAVSEGDTTLNLLGLNSSNQITYDGAIGDGSAFYVGVGPQSVEALVSGGGTLVHHGSNDRFIFTDVNLEGKDTIDGGAPDADGVNTWVGNADVLEIRHLNIDGAVPEVVGADLSNITNVGTIVFNNDTVSEQTLILNINDANVDAMVDSLHTATAAQSETLYVVAQDGTLPYSSTGFGSAVLDLDASTLGVQSNLDITLDTHLYVADDTYNFSFSGGGSNLGNGYGDETGYDVIVTGSGSDTIHGVTSGDQVNAGLGSDTVDFTTDFSDNFYASDNQLQNVEHFVTANNSNIDLWYQSENLDIIIGNGGSTNNNQIIGGSAAYTAHATWNTLTFTDNYEDTAIVSGGTSVLNNALIQYIHNLVVDGREYGVAVDGAISVAGVDGVTHFPHESINIVDRVINVNISDQTEAFNITLTDNVGGAGDTLVSGSGADTITGGTGHDYITGADGADIINGGVGIDTYLYDYSFVNDASHSSVSSTSGAPAGFDVVTVTEGDQFDFNIPNPSLLFAPNKVYFTVGGAVSTGTDLLNALNAAYGTVGHVAGANQEAVLIHLDATNGSSEYIVVDGGSEAIDNLDIVIQVVGTLNHLSAYGTAGVAVHA